MDMKQEVNLLVRSRGVAGRLSFRSGDPTDPTDLMKVSADRAADILIMSAGSNNRKSDQRAIQTLLALAALPKQLSEDCDVFAEVQNSDTLEVVNPLLPNNAECIVARDAVNQMLIIRALMPPVGYCFIELASYHKLGVDKNSIYPLDVPEGLVGVPFEEACRLFPRAVVCGIMPDQKDDGTFKTAVIPDKSAVLMHGDKLVVVATDAEAAECWELAPCRPERRPTLHSSVEDIFTSEGQLRLGPMGYGDVPSNVLMLGCPNDLASFLSFLDLYLPMGSHVHVLSPRSRESRESSLRRLSSISSAGTNSRLWEASPFFRVPERPKSNEGDEPENILHHIQVTHHTGSPTEKMSLAKMPLTTAHVCLILAEHHAEDEESAAIDSRNLTALILIRNLLVECGRDDLKRSGMPDRCKVLIELMDPKSRRVVEGNGNVRKLGSFVYSSALEIGMFAQAVREKSMYHFILQLLEPSCRTEHLVSYPVRYFVGKDDELSYWDLHASIWNSSGGILLGWKRKGDRYPLLNPPDKTAILHWSAHGDDQLLVLRPPSPQDNNRNAITDTKVVAETAALPVSNIATAVNSNLPHCVPPVASLGNTSVQ